MNRNMIDQARFSAPMPLRRISPETKIPIAQLVSIRLKKNATSAKPNP